MSRKQWGHGFHTGRKSAKARGYVGLWFYSLNESAQLQYQGRIVRRVDNDHWAAQLHSWLDGIASGQLWILDRAELGKLTLFESSADLRYGIHRYRVSHPDLYPWASEEDFEREERFLKAMSG